MNKKLTAKQKKFLDFAKKVGPLPTGALATNEPPPGTKQDSKKLRYSLLDPQCLELMVKVLEYGAEKYPVEENWKRVKPSKRYYDAIMRHLQAWRMGETKDHESGIHPLAHVAVDAMFLLWHEVFDKKENE